MELEQVKRSCYTCRHMATHAKCDGCLNGTPPGAPFPYRNWEGGDWRTDLARAELAGTRSIVVGGQGELEVRATERNPLAWGKHARYVAEQCGYMIGSIHNSPAHDGCREYLCSLPHGCFAVVFGAVGLACIEYVRDDESRECVWSRDATAALVSA